MDAIVTAGGIPLPEEPLYPATKGSSKAMVDIAGRPMIQWVLDALDQAKTIDRIVIVGLTEKSNIRCKKPVFFVSNQGKMVENLRAGGQRLLEVNKKAQYALFVSSDIPAITGEMVDWVVNTAMKTKLDVYYNVIQREVMEKRFPDSRRTWTKLKDMEICGGDMNVGRLSLLDDENDLWDKITDSRKSPLKQAALIGFGTAFRLLFGKLSLKQAEESIMDKLEITGRAIVCPYAEVGMDVDKLFQLEIMRDDFKKRLKKAEKLAGGKKKKAKPASKAKKTAAKKTAPAKKPAAKAAPAKKPAARKTSKK
jgi:GTP:adenosylcobinamide-phosphate guanylyltransferase